MSSITKKRRPEERLTTTETTAQLSEKSALVTKRKVSTYLMDISSWNTAFQLDSILASYDADCLQYIFGKLIALPDALHLGLACRRLYYQWKESQKAVKEVEIARSTHCIEYTNLMLPKAYFLPNINNDTIEKGDFVKQELLLGSEECLLTSLQKTLDSFANLRHLEVSAGLDEDSFAPFLSQLTASSMPQLTTLKLYPELFDSLDSPDSFWGSLAQLQLPTLRHLTFCSIYPIFGRSARTVTIPPLPILSQLTSVDIFVKEKLSTLYQIIRQLIIDSPRFGAHLKPGTGARFGLSLHEFFGNEGVKLPLPKPELLSYITYFKLAECLFPPNRAIREALLQCLPQMRHLAKVELSIESDNPSSYPSYLTALSSLGHLQELTIKGDMSYTGKSRLPVWPRSSLPVLSSVRVLSLLYSTVKHTDVAQRFHLAHCFPRLRTLKCYFVQRYCRHCAYRRLLYNYPSKKDLSRLLQLYQTCGRELSRGVLQLAHCPKTAVLKKVILQFNFDYGYFSSLENLLAGKKDNPNSDPYYL